MTKETEAWQQEMDKLFHEAIDAIQSAIETFYQAYVCEKQGAVEKKIKLLTVTWQDLARVEWHLQVMLALLQNTFAPPHITYLPSEDFKGSLPRPKRITQKFGEPVGPPSEDDVP